MSIPTLAAALTFITYSLLGNELDASVIFSSLTIFQILRIPMAYLCKLVSFAAFLSRSNVSDP